MTSDGRVTRGWAVDAIGAAPRLTEVELPPPGPGEVRLRVAAAAFNHADLLMIAGTYQETPAPPFCPGLEMAGRIEALGPGVTGFAEGQRVAAFAGHGGLAEEANVAADRVFPIPDGMEDAEAAALTIAHGTSLLALARRARLAAGETLVVLGAAGGVGLTAVEIGHAMGARVVAVARGAERLEIARDAGADAVIDSGDTTDFRDRLHALGPVDVVYDAVGGSLGEAALRSLAPEGRYLAVGFASGKVPQAKLNHLLVKNVDVIGVYWGAYAGFAPGVLRDGIATLHRWHGEGRIRVRIGLTIPFERAPDGLAALAERRVTGKVVVTR